MGRTLPSLSLTNTMGWPASAHFLAQSASNFAPHLASLILPVQEPFSAPARARVVISPTRAIRINTLFIDFLLEKYASIPWSGRCLVLGAKLLLSCRLKPVRELWSLKTTRSG